MMTQGKIDELPKAVVIWEVECCDEKIKRNVEIFCVGSRAVSSHFK